MSVSIEVVALIIPIRNIDRVYPGGFDQYKKDNAYLNKRLFDFDEHLVRIGAMDSGVIEEHIRRWEGYGLIAFDVNSGQPIARDFCTISNWVKAKRECPWLIVDEERSSVRWNDPADISGEK